MAEIVFVGVGEAIDPARANTSTLYRGARVLLVDCGYAVPHAFWQIETDPDALDAIYLTHTHADHAFGLPALLLWMRLHGRTRALDIFGGPGVQAAVELLLELGYPGSFAPEKCFPIRHHVVLPGETTSFGPLTFRNARTSHGVPNHALRLESPEHGAVCFSGDGAPTAASRALYRGAALVVHECFWAEAPPDPKLAAKHADLRGVVALFDDTKVSSAWLVHFAVDARDALTEALERLGDARLHVAEPGRRVSLT